MKLNPSDYLPCSECGTEASMCAYFPFLNGEVAAASPCCRRCGHALKGFGGDGLSSRSN